MAFEDSLGALSPTFWWKLNEASGNFADSGSGGATLTANGTIAYNQTGPGLPGLSVPSTKFATSSTQGYGQSGTLTNVFSGGTNIFTVGVWIQGGTSVTWGITVKNFNLFTEGIFGTSSKTHGAFDAGGPELTFGTGNTIGDGNWHFLVATASVSGGNLTVSTYHNGTQANTNTQAGSLTDATNSIYVGLPAGGSGTANLFMCEAFVIQGTALSTGQVSNLYSAATAVVVSKASSASLQAVTRASYY